MHRPVEWSPWCCSNGFNANEVKRLEKRVVEILKLNVGSVSLPVNPCKLRSVCGLGNKDGKSRQYRSEKLLHLVNLQGFHTVLQLAHQVLVKLGTITQRSHVLIQAAKQFRDLSVRDSVTLAHRRDARCLPPTLTWNGTIERLIRRARRRRGLLEDLILHVRHISSFSYGLIAMT